MRSFQWRLTFPLIVLIIVSMGALGIYLTMSVKNTQIDNLRFHLEQEARITAEAALPSLLGGSNAADELAKKLGQEIDSRVTIIAPDGAVLGDSIENPANMENHATRPEVADALANGIGEATRYSTTLAEQMMYVAVTISNQGETIGIARAALPLTAVENLVRDVRWTIILGMLIITVLTVIATWMITRIMTRPIRQMTQAAQGMAAGRLGEKISIFTRDEAGRLGQAFNEMSANLKTTIDSISAEKAKLTNVLANMADGVIMTDTTSGIILINHAAGNLFGFRESDAAGKHLIEVVHDHEVDEVLKACIKTGKEQTTQFVSGTTRRFLRAIAVPLQNQGHINGALMIIQDLTELRNMQTMRRELVGNISHELRTPIAGIKAMVETLMDGAINDKEAANDFLGRIQNEVDKLSQIVSEITQLSRIETSQAELKMEPVDLNTLVNEIVKEMNPLAERQHVNLQETLAPGLPAVRADKDRIRQTIINLIHNAIKFNIPGGNVAITTACDEKSITVEVTDTGIGISKQDLPHVFERFYKAEKSRTGGGSGLGLAIAKHTIQAHGGHIYARSEEGTGSTFTFHLPR